MIGTARVSTILTVLGTTPAVKNGRGPVSAQLIAPSDAGKSQLLLAHQPPHARVINDMTFASLLALLDEDRPPKWLIVPDLNQALSHKETVSNLTMSFLLSLLGEGVTEIPGIVKGEAKLRSLARAIAKQKGRGITMAMLTGLTPHMFLASRSRWRGTGLLRRFVPIFYSYGTATQTAIQTSIRNGSAELRYDHVKLKAPRVPVTVTIPAPIASDLERLSETITMNHLTWKDSRGRVQPLEYAFSVHKTVRTYAQAYALVNGRTRVSRRDWDGTRDFAEFFRYDRPEML